MATAEKRSVHTDALATLGTIIDDTAKRDAIHLAVLPAIAGQDLFAGQDVGLVGDVAMANAETCLGIVDPFLGTLVHKGEMFWLVIYPRVITSLRHVWSHPNIDEEPVQAKQDERQSQLELKEASELWIRQYAEAQGLSYYELMEGAHNTDGDYIHISGMDAHGDVNPEFWKHYTNLTGVNPKFKATHFSCSC